jgi:uncharacterized protein (UPF0261 family)
MRAVYVVGTADTKGVELGFVRDLVASHGVPTVLVDVGTSGHRSSADITPEDLAVHHPDGPDAVRSTDRGEAGAAMSLALERYVAANADDIGGMLGLGGSGGTALIAPAMRVLPVGRPKLLVSTVASGNVAQYVGPTDITMMYSVTDVAGLNRISRVVLANAANAVAGMVAAPAPSVEDDRPVVTLTMFGVTTPLVTELVHRLEDAYDPLVFHATGTGGRSMEKLVDQGLVHAVLDVTTTEVCDHLVGGVFPATDDRFGAVARTGVPYVGSCGALDMVNFGAPDTIPDRFDGRRFHVHNSQVTLMRTTVEENVAFGTFIAERLNRCEGPVRFLLPEGGVSMLDAPGQPFHDPEADEALFSTLERLVEQNDRRRLRRVPHAINDPGFVDAVLDALDEVAGPPPVEDR